MIFLRICLFHFHFYWFWFAATKLKFQNWRNGKNLKKWHEYWIRSWTIEVNSKSMKTFWHFHIIQPMKQKVMQRRVQILGINHPEVAVWQKFIMLSSVSKKSKLLKYSPIKIWIFGWIKSCLKWNERRIMKGIWMSFDQFRAKLVIIYRMW